MATIKRNFGTDSDIEGSSGSPTTLNSTTEEFSSDVDLETNGYEGAHVVVDIDFNASGTQNVVVSAYASLDGSNYDDVPFWSQEVDVADDPGQISLLVMGFLHFRLGFKHAAAESNNATVWAHYQAWNYVSV